MQIDFNVIKKHKWTRIKHTWLKHMSFGSILHAMSLHHGCCANELMDCYAVQCTTQNKNKRKGKAQGVGTVQLQRERGYELL